jgi:hypothetical protein
LIHRLTGIETANGISATRQAPQFLVELHIDYICSAAFWFTSYPDSFFILFCWMSFFAGMATWCISTMGSWPRLHYITGHCKVHCPRPPGKRSQGKFLLKAEKCYCNIH